MFRTSATLTASGATTYTWSNSVTGSSQTVSPTTTTIYTVSGTNAAGCVSAAAASTTVNVSGTPTISINSVSLCAGQTTTLTATGATNYTWSTTQNTSSIVVTPALIPSIPFGVVDPIPTLPILSIINAVEVANDPVDEETTNRGIVEAPAL